MTSPINSTATPGDDRGVAGSRAASSKSTHRRRRHAQRVIVIVVAAGGVCGAVFRYWLSLTFPTSTGEFPWTTFTINVTGSALLGFLLILLLEQFPNGRLSRPLIGTGFLGAYTTFSTYSVDAVLLVRDHHVATAVIYVLATLIFGMLALWCGMTSARLAVRTEHWLQKEVQ